MQSYPATNAILTDTLEYGYQWQEEVANKCGKIKEKMNNYHRLTWEFSDRTTKVDYLDVTISINNGKITFDLFEKALNLYLYIPLLSAHSTSVLASLVMGNCHRIYTLVSSPKARRRHLTNLFQRLLRRGYQRNQLLPLFK